MAELGIASSIAGLISLADSVVRISIKYFKDVKDADKSVNSLIEEVHSLALVLYNLSFVVQHIEAAEASAGASSYSSSQIHHIHLCQTTLETIKTELEHSIPSTKTTLQKLKWPFKKSATMELLAGVQRHKSTMSLAIGSEQMSTLLKVLARQEQHSHGLASINASLEADRAERRSINITHARRNNLNILSTIDIRTRHESNIRLRQPGTGVWFTDSKELKDWMGKDHSKLWVHGIAGAGKTILVASAIQQIEKMQGPSHVTAMFYCDYKDVTTHDPRTILGALARQLIVQHDNCFVQLERFYQQHRITEDEPGNASLEDFCDLIVQLSTNFVITNIVVDGLDEVTGDRAEVTRLLQSLNTTTGTIKTLFASHKEVDIGTVLADYPAISIAAGSSDLRIYVHSEIETRTKRSKLRIRDPELQDEIAKSLIEGADGMFRWVACQIDYLCECSNDRDRREALKKLPPDLPSSYERILERVNQSSKENQIFVKNTLNWIVYAKKRLTTDKLLQAVAIRPGDDVFEESMMSTEAEVLNWCSSLVRKNSRTGGLELAHFTVKEFLTGIDPLSHKFASYRLSGDHSSLALTCMAFLKCEKFDGKPPPVLDLGSEKEHDSRWLPFFNKYPIMPYVFRYWPTHVHRSQWSEIGDEVLMLFTETNGNFAFWTAVYRLYPQAFHSPGTVMDCVDWLLDDKFPIVNTLSALR